MKQFRGRAPGRIKAEERGAFPLHGVKDAETRGQMRTLEIAQTSYRQNFARYATVDGHSHDCAVSQARRVRRNRLIKNFRSVWTQSRQECIAWTGGETFRLDLVNRLFKYFRSSIAVRTEQD